MKIVFFVLLLLFASRAIATSAETSSARVTYVDFTAFQEPGSDEIKWKKKRESSYVRKIDPETGFRWFYNEDGSVHHGADKRQTLSNWKGQVIPDEKRFIRLPPGDTPLVPGISWDATRVLQEAGCGLMPFDYSATSSQGPPITILVDGEQRTYSTIQIEYTATLRICQLPGEYAVHRTWSKKKWILYVPELNEIVDEKTVGITKGNWIGTGKRWSVTAIDTRSTEEK